MQEFIEEITEEDARQLKSLIRDGITKIRQTLEQIARDDEEIQRIRHRSALLMADTKAVLDRMERR